jgi:hypothetical protein
MKNLFNNISREEKNRILEMHSGKKGVIFENAMNVIPRDFVLLHLEMSKLYPYLVKKDTPINVKNGIVSFNASFSNSHFSGDKYRDSGSPLPNVAPHGGRMIENTKDGAEIYNLMKRFCVKK